MNKEPSSSPPTKAVSSLSLAWLLLGGAAVIIGVVVYYTVIWQPEDLELPEEQRPKPVVTLEQLRSAMEQGDTERVLSLAETLLEKEPETYEATVIAGDALLATGRVTEALQWLGRVPEETGVLYLDVQAEIGDLESRQGKLREAEQRWLKIIQRDESHIAANEKLARVLSVEGRRWESARYLEQMLKLQSFGLQHLLFVGNLQQPIDEPELLELARRAEPDYWIPELGRVQLELSRQQYKPAEARLVGILQNHPDFVEAHVAQGRILVEQDRWKELPDWHSRLPSGADDNPGVWYLRGRWAEHTGQTDAAIRCYWEGLNRHAGDVRMCSRAGKLLAERGRESEAKIFLDYAAGLEQLNEVLSQLYASGPSLRQMVQAAELTESLGRIWESLGWYRWTLEQFPEKTALRPNVTRLTEIVARDPPLVLESLNPARRVSLETLPLPNWMPASRDE